MQSSIDRMDAVAEISGDGMPALGGKRLTNTTHRSVKLKVQVDSLPFAALFDSPATALIRSCPDSPFCQFQKEIKVKNIFVGNLSYNVSENAIRSLFEEYGTVDRVSVVTDRDTGQQKGFAFVEMSIDAEGDRAIESLSGREMNGRALTVNEARPKADRGSGGGGGGYGNRGGGSGRGSRY
jgi:cold-inducible RNA-binding protein